MLDTLLGCRYNMYKTYNIYKEQHEHMFTLYDNYGIVVSIRVGVWLLIRKDLELLDLFYRYLDWIQDNNLKDTIDNYAMYVTDIERFDFSEIYNT